MTTNTKTSLEAGVMQITLGTFTGDFFVAGIPDQMYAVAITGLVSDEKNHDTSMQDSRRIAACWNACDGIDTEQLEILGDNHTTLKERYEALKAEMRAVPLAKKHQGMMVDYSGMLRQARENMKRNAGWHKNMLEQLQGHLEILGTRFYAGDLTVVDEFLQLYCISEEDRERVVAQQSKEAA